MPKIENLFFIIFRTFRVEKLKNLDDMHIVSALVELNDRSNISGTSGDRDFDETWLPAGHRNMVISDAEETSEEEVGVLLDGRHDRLDQELPDLDSSMAPRPSKSSGQPPKKRAARREGSGSGRRRTCHTRCPTCHIV